MGSTRESLARKKGPIVEELQVEKFTVEGLAVRTCNEHEMNPNTAKIGAHVAYVDSNVEIDYKSGSHAYSVYSNYESDANGFYDVLMGSNKVASSKVPLASVEVKAGKYLRFDSEGAVPECVISAWQEVWAYFGSQNCLHTRAFTTDFELYESPTKVSIYIALK